MWCGTVTDGRDDPPMSMLKNLSEVSYICALIMRGDNGVSNFLFRKQVDKNLVTSTLQDCLAHNERNASISPAGSMMTIDIREVSLDASCKIGSTVLKRTAMRLAFLCLLPVVKEILQDGSGGLGQSYDDAAFR